MARRSLWYDKGYSEGRHAAEVALATPSERRAVQEAIDRDLLGELAGEVREHQAQFAGDITYDVGRPGGPTERQYELWENGFFDAYRKTALRGPRPKGPTPSLFVGNART
jgi:hypothetical protein